MVNWFSSIGDFFRSIPSKINKFASGARDVIGKVGSGINKFTNGARDVYGKIRKIPVIGNVIGASPVGSIIDTGLDVGNSAGNLLQNIGGGDYSGAVNNLGNIVNRVGTSDKAKLKAGDFIKNLLG